MSLAIPLDEPLFGGVAEPSTEILWWLADYPFRRHIKLDPVEGFVPDGHPINVVLSKEDTINKNKVRTDYADIAVLWLQTGATRNQWTPLPHDVIDNGPLDFTVQFPAQAEFSAPDSSYYIYYGNAELRNVPDTGLYIGPEWPIIVNQDGFGTSYTRLGIDWVAAPVELPPRAGGPMIGAVFVDSFWFPTTTEGYTSVEIEMIPEVDGSPDGYFWAYQVWCQNLSSSFPGTQNIMYIGLQSEGNPLGGHVAHFAGFGASAGSSDGFAGQFTNEGTGWKTQISFPWDIGNLYRLRITKISDDGTNAVWGGYVLDVQTGTETPIGMVTMPSSAGNCSNGVATFHERYAAAGPTPQPSAVIFTDPTANQGTVAPAATLVQKVTTGIPNYYVTLDGPNAVESFSGTTPPVPGPAIRSQRPAAQASFLFYGDRIEVLAQTSPDSGNASIHLDNDAPDTVDFYSPTINNEVVVWQKKGLAPELHRIYVTPAGSKDPKASDLEISLQGYAYRKSIVVTDLGEDINALAWSSIFVGGPA